MVFIYKNDNPRLANDTSIDFLKNGDIRVDGAEYGTCIREYQSHDDELAFSIRKEDFTKLINAIKKEKPNIKIDENECMLYLNGAWDRLSKKQQEVFMYLKARFSEELGYRHIKYLCDEAGIVVYDVVLY